MPKSRGKLSAKLAELTKIILQLKGQGTTSMFEDLYHKLNNIKKMSTRNQLQKID